MVPGPRRRDPQATRAAILNAAEKIFVDHGFTGTHLSDIAKKAGVTKSLIHHHFGSKKQLWEEIKRQQFSKYAVEQAKILQDRSVDADVIRDTLVQYFKYLQKNPRFSRLLTWMKIEGDQSCGDIADELGRQSLSGIQQAQQDGILRKDINPLFVFITLIGLVESWFEAKHQFLSHLDAAGTGSGQEDEAYLSSMLKMFFEGLLPR
jgi:TetR/AcrR family transcriptional regulator